MILLSDLISRIRTQHEMTGARGQARWSDGDILDIINEGLETLAEETHFYERYTTIPFSRITNRVWFDLRGFAPETVVRVTSIYNSNRTEWLRPVSTQMLPWDWVRSVGEPQVFFTRGIYQIGTWPHSNGTAGFLRVHYSGLPQKHRNVTEVTLRDLPDNHLQALEYYCLYEMSMQDREPKRGLQLYQKYLEREKQLRDFIDNRKDEAGRIHVLGGGHVEAGRHDDMW